VCITLGGRTADNTGLSQILVKNRDFCLPHLHSMPLVCGPHQNSATTFGIEKQEWCGYQRVKNFEDMFTRFDRIYERDKTDRLMDGRTDTA